MDIDLYSLLPGPDDIVLFVESGSGFDEWCYWGDLTLVEQIELEGRDHRIIKFETEEWMKLHE